MQSDSSEVIGPILITIAAILALGLYTKWTTPDEGDVFPPSAKPAFAARADDPDGGRAAVFRRSAPKAIGCAESGRSCSI